MLNIIEHFELYLILTQLFMFQIYYNILYITILS